MLELNAGGFQCPENGIPCVLLFDEEYNTVRAEVENNGFDYPQEDLDAAEAWCERFGTKPCESYEDACWIPDRIERDSNTSVRVA